MVAPSLVDLKFRVSMIMLVDLCVWCSIVEDVFGNGKVSTVCFTSYWTRDLIGSLLILQSVSVLA